MPNLSVLSQGFPTNALSEPNTPSLFSLDTNLRTPYVMQWHLTFQYQLDQNTMLETSYVGSKSNKDYLFLNLNQAAPSADPSAAYAPRRPFSYVNASISYLKSGGNANYNALQLSLQHRLTHGLSLIMNYTYSKALGDASSANLDRKHDRSAIPTLRISSTGRWILTCAIALSRVSFISFPLDKGSDLAGEAVRSWIMSLDIGPSPAC